MFGEGGRGSEFRPCLVFRSISLRCFQQNIELVLLNGEGAPFSKTNSMFSTLPSSALAVLRFGLLHFLPGGEGGWLSVRFGGCDWRGGGWLTNAR